MRVNYTYLFGLVFLFSSDKYIEAELLDHVAVLVSILWGISTLFSIVTTPISTPTNSVQGFPFLYTLVNICHFLSFW